jgi:hypothetical protein
MAQDRTMPAPRRSPLDDRSLSGKLAPRLFSAAGVATLILAAVSVDGYEPWLMFVLGVMACGLGAVCWRLQWDRVPAWIMTTLCYGGVGMVAIAAINRPRVGYIIELELAMVLVFAGFSLARRDLVVMSGLSGAIILWSQWLVFPRWTAIWHTVVIWMMATIMGVVMHWLRRLLDDRAADVAAAQAELGEIQVRALTEQRQADSREAQIVADRLAEQTQLQGQVAEQATTLARSAAEVSQNTTTAASATEQMSTALRELLRTAQATEQITGAVSGRADSAVQVIKALEASSAQIMTASDVIQSIAEQTNLLALNATIESARAGESGRGFAVVANEVRELARQSGQNADAINRTLTEVRGQVAAAVTQVLEIANGMTELSDHHHTLAAAIEQQSATVAAVASTVQRTADETHTMAVGIRTLEQISLTANA